MTQTKEKKELDKKEIKEIISNNYKQEKEKQDYNYKNHILIAVGDKEDYISKSLKEIASNYMDTQDAIHNLSIDTTYSLDVLSNDELSIYNATYDSYINDYIKELNSLKKQDLSYITDKEELNNLIKRFNIDYENKFIHYIRQNDIDLYDKTTRKRQILYNAERIAKLQYYEIKKYGYDLFLKADLNTLNRPFIFYMNLNKIQKVQNILKDIKKDIHNFSINDLIKETGINDVELNQTLEILGIEVLGRLENQDIQTIQDNAVENFLYILLLYQEITEHYNIINNILTGNLDLYIKRHKNIKKVRKLVKDISTKYSDYYNLLDSKKDIISLDNNNYVIEKMREQNKKLEHTKINTTFLSNKIFTGKDIQTGKEYSITFKERTTQEDISTSITIYDSNSNIIKLSKEHRDINDAVGSLLDNGIPYITIKQFYNFINKGIISNDPVEKDKLDELLKELYNMDKKADIDATEQFNLKGYKKYLDAYEKATGTKPRPIISQNLINFKILKNVPLPNGELIDIIAFLDYPAIYDYARQYRQLAPYPVEILNLNQSPKGSNANNTIQINELTKTIRNELIRCIEMRKSHINQPLVINNFLCINCQFYDVIEPIKKIDSNGIEKIEVGKVLNKQKRIRYTNNIEIILNNFKDKGYIKDYTINKQGKVNKYSITFKFNK